MKKQELKILSPELLSAYKKQAPKDLQQKFDSLKEAEISTATFSFYTSVAAMASSKIEGEAMDIDSYVKHKMMGVEYLENLTQKPNDLYQAYLFAQKSELTKNNFLIVHQLLAANLLPQPKRGVCRKVNMVMMEHGTNRIQYEAAPVDQLKGLFDFLWHDIENLKSQKLSVAEVFYFASFIHLVFEKIHPFEDGNGRAGRLLEKWFVAQLLLDKAWYLQSELFYYQHINDYYKNLNRLGMFYEQLDYTKALPFLLMLPNSLFMN